METMAARVPAARFLVARRLSLRFRLRGAAGELGSASPALAFRRRAVGNVAAARIFVYAAIRAGESLSSRHLSVASLSDSPCERRDRMLPAKPSRRYPKMRKGGLAVGRDTKHEGMRLTTGGYRAEIIGVSGFFRIRWGNGRLAGSPAAGRDRRETGRDRARSKSKASHAKVGVVRAVGEN